MSAPKETPYRVASVTARQGCQPPPALCPRLAPGSLPAAPQQPEGSRLSLHCPGPVYRAAEEVRVLESAPGQTPGL